MTHAHIVLRPARAHTGVDTNEKIAIRDVEPGGIRGAVRATAGVVNLPDGRAAGVLIFAIGANEWIVNLTFRLRPFAVMAGHSSFDDCEPAMNTRVEGNREFRKLLYTLAAGATTDESLRVWHVRSATGVVYRRRYERESTSGG